LLLWTCLSRVLCGVGIHGPLTLHVPNLLFVGDRSHTSLHAAATGKNSSTLKNTIRPRGPNRRVPVSGRCGVTIDRFVARCHGRRADRPLNSFQCSGNYSSRRSLPQPHRRINSFSEMGSIIPTFDFLDRETHHSSTDLLSEVGITVPVVEFLDLSVPHRRINSFSEMGLIIPLLTSWTEKPNTDQQTS